MPISGLDEIIAAIAGATQGGQRAYNTQTAVDANTQWRQHSMDLEDQANDRANAAASDALNDRALRRIATTQDLTERGIYPKSAIAPSQFTGPDSIAPDVGPVPKLDSSVTTNAPTSAGATDPSYPLSGQNTDPSMLPSSRWTKLGNADSEDYYQDQTKTPEAQAAAVRQRKIDQLIAAGHPAALAAVMVDTPNLMVAPKAPVTRQHLVGANGRVVDYDPTKPIADQLPAGFKVHVPANPVPPDNRLTNVNAAIKDTEGQIGTLHKQTVRPRDKYGDALTDAQAPSFVGDSTSAANQIPGLQRVLDSLRGQRNTRLGVPPVAAPKPTTPPASGGPILTPSLGMGTGNIDLGQIAARADWAKSNPPKPGETRDQYEQRFLASQKKP